MRKVISYTYCNFCIHYLLTGINIFSEYFLLIPIGHDLVFPKVTARSNVGMLSIAYCIEMWDSKIHISLVVTVRRQSQIYS